MFDRLATSATRLVQAGKSVMWAHFVRCLVKHRSPVEPSNVLCEKHDVERKCVIVWPGLFTVALYSVPSFFNIAENGLEYLKK